MRQQTTPAIILRRINYGEADRIVTFLTPRGKIKALVKGVRRSKSKLAGGIELFSESTITFMETRGDLGRIVSTRLNVHWDGIVGNLGKMMFGYEAMKLIDGIIEDDADGDYFELLKDTFSALHDNDIALELVEVWFYMRMLQLSGHAPNLRTDNTNVKLRDSEQYAFSAEDMCFLSSSSGQFRAEHIKLLRLCQAKPAVVLGKVKDGSTLAGPLKRLLRGLATEYS